MFFAFLLLFALLLPVATLLASFREDELPLGKRVASILLPASLLVAAALLLHLFVPLWLHLSSLVALLILLVTAPRLLIGVWFALLLVLLVRVPSAPGLVALAALLLAWLSYGLLLTRHGEEWRILLRRGVVAAMPLLFAVPFLFF